MNLLIIIEIILALLIVCPKIFDIDTFVVTSGSMRSIYPVGSMIYVKKAEFEDIAKGDNITFYLDDIVATHQVYKIDEKKKSFKTQGIDNKDDNGNIIKDAYEVKYSSVIGKPFFCIYYLGYISKFFWILIFLSAIILLVNFILEKRLDYEKK